MKALALLKGITRDLGQDNDDLKDEHGETTPALAAIVFVLHNSNTLQPSLSK
ncbi:hypothetical protein BGZ96_012676 [Linnemannia gamsii]|uniref:Uncharacterized protein n=1 Tax=Linnemannia gamsii TaxID=64522 RepID=A0ABQ7JQL3_9FUNG|nr:hypothetical protein BGZ96_012676 [Linnemannia gamsii]